MTKENFDILNRLSLVEVMRGWGYVPHSESNALAWFICPWHNDHNPSLSVDKVVRSGAQDLGFKCWAGRDGHEGFGAVQLAAQLMDLPVGPVAKEDMPLVLQELATRCNVELQPEGDGKGHCYDTTRTTLVGWDEFKKNELAYAEWTGDAEFEEGEWTEEGLRALGLKVELACRKAKKSDIKGDEIQENTIKMGDTLTEFDPDSGLPLYRCSLSGESFYRDPKKAETRTIEEWGKAVEEIFGVKPVARFLQVVEPKQGGKAVRIVRATKNYPVFMFQYPWGVKKYEPKDPTGKSKWTWYKVTDDADLYHQWYADAALTDALTPGTATPEQDDTHPYVIIKKEGEKEKEDTPRQIRFKKVVLCSGPRDAIAVWSHSEAHVVWLHSEQAGFDGKEGTARPNRWLRSLIARLLKVTVTGGLYVCYDEDATGLAASQAIALNSTQVRWLRLPKELTTITVGPVGPMSPMCPTRHLKDVTDFVTRFHDVESRMPAEVRHDDPYEWFENALFDTPTCQFWQFESVRKDADGSERNRYKFDLRNTPVFLRARGMVRKVVQQEKTSFSRFFLLGNNHTYQELFPGERGANKLVQHARDLMAEWLKAHKEANDPKGALSRAIFSAKLEQSALESIETMDFDEHSYGEDYDHFFFHNTAVRVDAGEVKTVGYAQMKQWTNMEAILNGTFTYEPQAWHVVVNPLYEPERIKHEEILHNAKTKEEREQENMRWDQWQQLWHYLLKLDRPVDEMPAHFRFLRNCTRIFWEKEQTQELSKTELQIQDMYLISMLHALGSALVRHRSANRQQFIHITDNGTRREDLASGGTGKTAILELLSLMRRTLSIDGKALEGGNIKLTQETDKIVPGLHNIVALDELPQGFNPKSLYNYTLSLTSRGLYRESVVLQGDDLPKFVIASNEQIDLSSDSTSRRTYQILVSDWYHPRSMDGSRPAHTPADDFRGEGMKEVARNLSARHLNEARNILIGCTQLFLQLPDETLCPPRDSRALLRQALAASKDEQFTLWIAQYLADKRHLGIPIAKRELAISLMDYCGISVGEKATKAAYRRIRDNLADYIRTSVYVCNPPVVLLTPTDREKGFRRCAAWQTPINADGTLQTDSQGNRLPRVLEKKQQPPCYYFYLKSRIPRNFYDPSGLHDGDRDYVQAAPEKDPELEPPE